jgi:Skp family chaperone for outer membrane proteins
MTAGIESWADFMAAVKAMRTTQKEYSKTRTPSARRTAEKLEAVVDSAIKAHESRGDISGYLFGGEKRSSAASVAGK